MMISGDHPHTPLGGNSDDAVLVSLIEAVREALIDAASEEELAARFDQALEFTRVHFESEQMLMRLYGYPGYSSHYVDHEQTLKQMEQLREELLTADMEDSLALIDALVAGAINHMQTTDRELRLYLKSSTRNHH